MKEIIFARVSTEESSRRLPAMADRDEAAYQRRVCKQRPVVAYGVFGQPTLSKVY